MDPLRGTAWSDANTVRGFVHGRPNAVLMEWIAHEAQRQPHLRVLDIGCGAGRNAIPIAELGHAVVGVDLSLAMLEAARERVRSSRPQGLLLWTLAPANRLPLRDAAFDVVIAHGIWNLSPTDAIFREAVREASRAARAGALLFVFTFSRHTIPDEATPVAGQQLIYTQFSGQPQCFLTEAQLVDEMAATGFDRDAATVIREYNRVAPGVLTSGAPVIYEAIFRKR